MACYDFYKSNILNKTQNIIFILSFLIFYQIFKNLTFIDFFYIDILCVISLILFFLTNKKKLFFVLSIFFIFIIAVKILIFDRHLFFFFVLLSFVNDTSAYLIGKLLKGPVIIPKISPKKTWSGTLSSTLLSFLILLNFDIGYYYSFLISISFFLGDIYFSYFKRLLKIKDFSSLFGAHGGALDRFDSISLPIMFLGFYLYNHVS